jgi:hypothetical protein
MKRLARVFCLVILAQLAAPRMAASEEPASRFTPLTAVVPRIARSAEAYPGGRHDASNLTDGNPGTEYSSAGKGTDTQVDFDFGRAVSLAGFSHIDRFDPATVARSLLVVSDVPDFSTVLGQVEIVHANSRGGATRLVFPPVTARYARWQVTELGPQKYSTVGGSEIVFYEAGAVETQPSRVSIRARGLPAVVQEGDQMRQLVEVSIDYPYAEPVEAAIELTGAAARQARLSLGQNVLPMIPVPVVAQAAPARVTVALAGLPLQHEFLLQPVRPWELWFLPHSHNDIGYTHVQTEVEQKQWQYLDEAVVLAQRTADYPTDCQFRWNAEVMWAVDSYLRQAAPEKRDALIDAVRRGWVGLDALYGNELTGLCRPEELFQLTACARRVAREHGLTIDSAMISDVPGYTWGIVPALAQCGVKYLSAGPNHVHRIGRTLAAWGDKPFWWVSPSGQDRVLCWVAGKGYSWFHPGLLASIKETKPNSVFDYLDGLTTAGYAYDMVQLRYSIGGDNGPPDPDLPEFARQWNATYVWPRLKIATNGQMMREFERRYGEQLPEARGDFTPYWEDGAASSAQETALVRMAAERLVQAETLWSILQPPAKYAAAEYESAWRNVLLYNEHTWGAHCSITQPDSPFTLDQWKIKAAFALDADRQSRQLLAATMAAAVAADPQGTVIDIYNTCSWPRSDLVVLPQAWTTVGDRVQTMAGDSVPSQRLASGELAVLVQEVPPLAAQRLTIGPGAAVSNGSARADDRSLTSSQLQVRIDPSSGAIAGLLRRDAAQELVIDGRDHGLNAYLYVAGRDPAQPQGATGAAVRILDNGPLVATVSIAATAPGCQRLVREVRIVDGLDYVELTNVVDKLPIRTPESVHFGFAPDIPSGVLRLDVPWGVIQPERDQLPGACKNYFSVGRWIDVANDRLGLTCATLDAPLAEIGQITVDVSHPFDPQAWRERVEPTQAFYSYVMNNYWETNYKADQSGPTTFRYALRPHGAYQAAAAARFGAERSQPLLAVRSAPSNPPVFEPILRVEPKDVLVTSLKPSHDGKALIVRLFNAGDREVQASVRGSAALSSTIGLSSPAENAGPPVGGSVSLPAYGIVTLRAELTQ